MMMVKNYVITAYVTLSKNHNLNKFIFLSVKY